MKMHRFAQHQRIDENKKMAASTPPEDRIAPTPEPGEFYYDGPYIVFTEAYHLRRGWCCQSGCRHCPYGFQKPPVTEN
jgi:hypothetical protein